MWVTLPQVTVQVLNGLNRRHATSLITGVSANHDLPTNVVEQIIMRADGIPLFIEEVTKTIVEWGAHQGIATPGAGYQPASVDSVPISLQASLMARLDRLAVGKEVAQIGSVIGREFSFEMLQALAGLTKDQLERAFGELVQSGLIIAGGRPPDATYSFKHALVQDAAYASLLRERRREIHLRVAQALEKKVAGAGIAEPQLLAWHFGEAGVPEKSIDYYLRAAELATGRYALAEMVSHLRKGVRQLTFLPDSRQKLQTELTLQVALGRALIDHHGSGNEEVRQAFERAHELGHMLGDTEQLLRVHDGLLNYHFTHSQPAVLLRYAGEMLEVGQRTANVQAFLIARRSAGFANLLLGHFEKARQELQPLIAMYEVERDGPQHGLTTRDMKVSASTILGMCLTAMGYLDSGDALGLQGVKHAESINHLVSLFLGLRRACVQRMMQGNVDGVLELANRLLATNAKYEVFLGTREGELFHSWAQLKKGRDTQLLGRIRTCVEHLDTAKHYVMLPFFMACAADVIGHCGDSSGAATLLDRAAELANLTGEQWSTPEIIRLQSHFAVREQEEAIALSNSSLSMAREQGAKLWELRSAMRLAELLRDQEKYTEAHELLSPLYAWFVEGLDRPDLVAAKAVLKSVDPQSR